MAQFVTVNAGGTRESGDRLAAKVRLGGRTIEIKPGEIKQGLEIPCEVYRTGAAPVAVKNTTGSAIKVASATIARGKSIFLNAQVWTKVGG